MSVRPATPATSRGLARPAALVLLALTLGLGFALGRFGPAVSDGDQDPAELRQQLAAASGHAAELARELDSLRARSEVDRQALEMVRRDMVEQKRYATGLEEDLRFYRSLMAPENTQGTVRVRPPEIVRVAGDRQFAYRIIVVQEAAKHQFLRASLSVVVEGVIDGQPQSLELGQLSGEPEGGATALKFRYFQEVSGEVELPEGFEATGLAIEVKVTRPIKASVREEFPWRLQETFSNVGK